MSTELPEDVADILGPIGAREFNTAPDHSKPKLIEWARTLRGLDDVTFLSEAASTIHGSALVNSFRGNWDHEHCKGSAVYHEANRRHLLAGHDADCRGETIYGRAFRYVWVGQGHNPATYRPMPCTCSRQGDPR